jgi:tetratricopeptide (TPR) repeat protein
MLGALPAEAQTEYTLDDFDRWTPVQGGKASEPMLQQAQVALANNEPQRAMALADAFMEQNPLSGARSEALLIKGDALLAMDNEWQALFAYEEIARRYPTTASFVPALEREFEIAKAYANGLRKRFLGTFRLVAAGDDAQEILIRIQERLPGSELAEKAGMELADYYFRIRDMPLAADAYDLFVQNYPRSSTATTPSSRGPSSRAPGWRRPPPAFGNCRRTSRPWPRRSAPTPCWSASTRARRPA